MINASELASVTDRGFLPIDGHYRSFGARVSGLHGRIPLGLLYSDFGSLWRRNHNTLIAQL